MAIKRPDTPLGETPIYNMDSSTLSTKLKEIQEESKKRREAAYSQRKAFIDKRKEKRKSVQAGEGGRLQGLNVSLGGKIV